MSAALPVLKNTAAVTLGAAAAGLGYAALIEPNAFVVREFTMPVLSPGSLSLRVLHLSDIHMRPNQRNKQAWLRDLASWEPDLVVNTGDNLSHPRAVPAVVQALGDLLSVPGVFVFGSNDYFAPGLKNPLKYITDPDHRTHGAALPWRDSNPRPLRPERSTLPSCATPRVKPRQRIAPGAEDAKRPSVTRHTPGKERSCRWRYAH